MLGEKLKLLIKKCDKTLETVQFKGPDVHFTRLKRYYLHVRVLLSVN